MQSDSFVSDLALLIRDGFEVKFWRDIPKQLVVLQASLQGIVVAFEELHETACADDVTAAAYISGIVRRWRIAWEASGDKFIASWRRHVASAPITDVRSDKVCLCRAPAE